jgi:large subunit ribosomal protein L22
MKAYLHSVRIAPKKANLIARMVRGLSVPVAMEQLRRTNKKAARIMETLLRSAIANASHNDKQDAQTMVVKTVVVNQGTAYHRGMPKARGQMRPYRKFLSHITLTLGLPGDIAGPTKRANAPKKAAKTEGESVKKASPKAKTSVKVSGTRKKAESPSSDSAASSDSPASSR